MGYFELWVRVAIVWETVSCYDTTLFSDEILCCRTVSSDALLIIAGKVSFDLHLAALYVVWIRIKELDGGWHPCGSTFAYYFFKLFFPSVQSQPRDVVVFPTVLDLLFECSLMEVFLSAHDVS